MANATKKKAQEARREARAVRRAERQKVRTQRGLHIQAAMADHRTFMDEFTGNGNRLKAVKHPLSKILQSGTDTLALRQKIKAHLREVMARASADEG